MGVDTLKNIDNYILLDKVIGILVNKQYKFYNGNNFDIGEMFDSMGVDVNTLATYIKNYEKCGKIKPYISIDDIEHLKKFRKPNKTQL